jgi:hypothetical protein
LFPMEHGELLQCKDFQGGMRSQLIELTPSSRDTSRACRWGPLHLNPIKATAEIQQRASTESSCEDDRDTSIIRDNTWRQSK